MLTVMLKNLIYQSISSYTIMLIKKHQREKMKSTVFKKYLQYLNSKKNIEAALRKIGGNDKMQQKLIIEKNVRTSRHKQI